MLIRDRVENIRKFTYSIAGYGIQPASFNGASDTVSESGFSLTVKKDFDFIFTLIFSFIIFPFLLTHHYVKANLLFQL